MLIHCPECNKEISDKSDKCVHCGYPLSRQIKPPITENATNDLTLIFENFLYNPITYQKDLCNIFADVKQQIDTISSEHTNDELSITLSSNVIRCSDYCNWSTYKTYFKLVNFADLSEQAVRDIFNMIFNKLSEDDILSIGNHILMWYPIHQLLLHGTEDIKIRLNTFLESPNGLGGKKIDDVMNMVNDHNHETSSVNDFHEQTSHNLPRCPYCASIDLKKISGLSKAGNVALWGIFALGKVSKQWHCNNCKSDF